MNPSQRLAELRAKCNLPQLWTNNQEHGSHPMDKSGCFHGSFDDAAACELFCFAANHAQAIAQRERELEERCEKLRERLAAQTKATQTIASELHNRVVESIVRIIGQPDYVDVQGHPIEQVVSTVLWRTVCDHQDTKDQLAAANAEIERLTAELKQREE